MNTERREELIENLIRRSVAVLKSFRSGRAPTFEQLDRLESALTPFTTDKLCGHRLDEACECAVEAKAGERTNQAVKEETK